MYARELDEAFKKAGHNVSVAVFSSYAWLPLGVRHIVFFFKLLRVSRGAHFVLALDTWSVGMPALCVAKITHTPLVVRIGGDFLWESYVGRTGEQIVLTEFYEKPRKLSLKESLIQSGTRYLVRNAVPLFTTRFQRDLWHRAYGAREDSPIVENFFPGSIGTYLPSRGPVFVSAGRNIALKNTLLLQRVMSRLANDHPGLELDTRFLQGEEHSRRLAQAYALVIPSLSEVCSNSAIDAVYLGKPFICPKDTGTSERLTECGLFVDTRSEGALTQAIESLLDPQVYEKLASAARSFSFTHSWDEMANEITTALSRAQ